VDKRKTPEGVDEQAAAVEELSLALVETTLKALSNSGQLSVLQTRVLLAVAQHGPISLGDLAASLDLSLPSASRLVTRLVDDGLLLRRVPPYDRRITHLVVSARGRRMLGRLRSARQREINRVFAELSAADRAALTQGLQAFAEASGPRRQETA
jgi:DNA-binding MarR family transcriptional regulator